MGSYCLLLLLGRLLYRSACGPAGWVGYNLYFCSGVPCCGALVACNWLDVSGPGLMLAHCWMFYFLVRLNGSLFP